MENFFGFNALWKLVSIHLHLDANRNCPHLSLTLRCKSMIHWPPQTLSYPLTTSPDLHKPEDSNWEKTQKQNKKSRRIRLLDSFSAHSLK